MIIDIARLSSHGEAFGGEESAEILEWEDDNPIMHPNGPLHYQLSAKIVGPELLVQGSVWEDFAGICVRCGADIVWTARDDAFCESFELSEIGDELDLTEELRQSILFALPNHPVCREDCPGLCPRCHKRLALGPCGCGYGEEGEGWNAFSSLTLPEAADGGKTKKRK